MIDIIENDLLKKHMPAVSYLRLDGSVPTNMRHEIVTRFNQDPTQDLLLLTTQVRALEDYTPQNFFFVSNTTIIFAGWRARLEPYWRRYRDIW